MRVFIMWAGEQSHSVALALKEFPEFVVRGPRYFISDDIEAGHLWRTVLAGELEAASFGIACLTPDNLRSHWLHFEAGALSKAVGKSNVIPFLVGPARTDLERPLADFQILDGTEAGVRKLVSLIAARVPEANREVIDKSFGFVWQELADRLESVRAAPREKPAEPLRDDSSLLREVLERLRRMEARESVAISAARASESHGAQRGGKAIEPLKSQVATLLDEIEPKTTQTSMDDAIAGWRHRLNRPGVTYEEVANIYKEAASLYAYLDR